MSRMWIVRMLADDGSGVEGRLELRSGALVFRPGTRGTAIPAVVVERQSIDEVALIPSGLGHHIEVAVADGRRLQFDYGVLPIDGLARAIEATSFGANARHDDDRTMGGAT